MEKFLKTFVHDEEGAITVDWVVLTAAALALALLVSSTVQTGSLTKITQIWADVDVGIASIN
jgi:Flp pilus assembly pilin Flp